jgi:molybdopterin-guanine dinucleotide biosynthesis protein B
LSSPIPIISIVGQSGSGKTCLLEKIIQKLKYRGYNLAVIKHSSHSFDLDLPGKDSWRYMQAGADQVLIASTRKWALISKSDSELPLKNLQQLLQGVDIILTEGYSKETAHKIEVLAQDSIIPLFWGKNLIAVVGDVGIGHSVPFFDRKDYEGLVNFIEGKFLAHKKEV